MRGGIERGTRSSEARGLDAQRLGAGDQIGLVAAQEIDDRRQHDRFGGARPQRVGIHSRQRKEAWTERLVASDMRQREQRKGLIVTVNYFDG